MMTDEAWFTHHRTAEFRLRPPIRTVRDGHNHEPWYRSEGRPNYHLGREFWTCQILVTVNTGAATKSRKRAAFFSFAALRPVPEEESNPWILLTDRRLLRFDDIRRALRGGVEPDMELELYLLDLPDRSDEFKKTHLAELGDRLRHYGRLVTLAVDDLGPPEPTYADLWVQTIALGANIESGRVQFGAATAAEVATSGLDLKHHSHTYDLAALRFCATVWENSGGVIYRLSPDLLDHLLACDFEGDDEPAVLPRTSFALDLSFARAEALQKIGLGDPLIHLPNAILANRLNCWVGTEGDAEGPQKEAIVGWMTDFVTAATLGSQPAEALRADLAAHRENCRVAALQVQALVGPPERGSFLSCDRAILGRTWRDWRDDIQEFPQNHDFAAMIHRIVYNFCRLAALRVKVGRPFDNPATETPRNPRKAGPHGPKRPSIIAADATITLPRKVYETSPVQNPGTGPDRAHLIPAETTRAGHKRTQRFGPGRSQVRTIEIAERPHTKVYRRPDRTETRVNVLLGDVPKAAVSE